jgi:hypothetical protein
MRPLAGPKGDDLGRGHFDAAAHRRRFPADRQHYENRTGGHRDKGDPRQFLLAGRYAQPV